jgi:outer membrane protein
MWLKKKFSIFLCIGLFAIGSAMSQEETALSELVNRALDQNYQLLIVRNSEQMAQNQNTIGNAGFLPSVNIQGNQVWGIQNTEQQFFNGDVRSGDNARSVRQDALIELDWTVFDGFRMFASRDQLSGLAQISSMNTKFYIEQTIADIADLYYQLITEIKMMESLERTLEISLFRFKLEGQKRNVGTGNALLYHQALIDFNSDSAMVVNQQRLVRELKIQINRIISSDPWGEIIPDTNTIDLAGIENYDEILQKALTQNTDLERSKLEELIAESNIRIERAARYPQISVFGNYSYAGQTNEVGFIESSTVYGAQYGIRVRFNLFDGGKQNIRIRNALLEQQSAEVATQDNRSEIESYLASLTNSYNAYMQQYQLLETSLKAAESSLNIAREQLQEGFISGFDFRQAQLTSLRVENQIAALMLAMKTIEIDIMRISGGLTENIL